MRQCECCGFVATVVDVTIVPTWDRSNKEEPVIDFGSRYDLCPKCYDAWDGMVINSLDDILMNKKEW